MLDPGALVQDGVEEQQAEVCATGEIRVIGPARACAGRSPTGSEAPPLSSMTVTMTVTVTTTMTTLTVQMTR